MIKRFGFGYERRSKNCPSILTARAEFLQRISDLKPDAVATLFNAAYEPFTHFLETRRDAIQAESDRIQIELQEKAPVISGARGIRKFAVKTILQNWAALRKNENADSLCDSIQGWSVEQNLNDTWCLDHALKFLIAFDGREERNIALSIGDYCLRDVLRRSWHEASIDLTTESLLHQCPTNGKVASIGIFEFNFRFDNIAFRVTGPFYKSISEFKVEVDRCFGVHGGTNVRGAKTALNLQRRIYLENVREVSKQLNLQEPPARWAENHLTWLVKYQIPVCESFRAIGRECNRDPTTVRDGIKEISELLGLTLRHRDKHIGRPRGVKDSLPRRRVDRRLVSTGKKGGEMPIDIL